MTRVTIHELARRLDISKASVSYALNDRPGVSDATRARVLALAADLGWHPSSSARALSRSRVDAIGMVLKRDPDLLGTEPYYMSLLGGVEDVLLHAGQSLLLRMVGTGEGRDIAVYKRWSAERRVDGVIVLDLAVDDQRPELLNRLGMPYVLHGIRHDPETGGELVEDLLTDAATIVEHIAALGHTELAHVTGPLALAHEVRRRDAVIEEAAARGIRSIVIECDYTMRSAQRMMGEALGSGCTATAVIASNDVMALGISAALRSNARDDVALVSWDDSMICQIATPTVTALARHPEDQGRRSARLLLDILDGIPAGPEQPIASILCARETSVRHA
ncbi:LacI family DNA-binding transcriptional regulator [Microbacterium sp. STN6]|uniref:LacI family DNA-binding transcriptional regulator n=1 Tax=Microbacterium sp. STN6 TaxID=2995588 RepID=UPI002260DBFC|nr:LacI family DNA-binding transcriptional regulator [Microbacterium sp. STN6]MCX7521103.1 LacI family DNA-binding transcriptional regulator [Microbacterium sp. STN6]